MKEIDLLPIWYRNKRRRQLSCRTQYVILGCVFGAIIFWGFVTAGAVSKAQASFMRAEKKRIEAEKELQAYNLVSGQVRSLREKALIMDSICSKIDVAGVLAEMSFLINDKIVVKSVDIISEKFGQGGKSPTNIVRAGPDKGKSETIFGNVRFRIVLRGIASDVGGVADLICSLEDSDYFCQVIPLFSESKKVKAGGKFEKNVTEITEFEMGCFLQNYKEFSGNN